MIIIKSQEGKRIMQCKEIAIIGKEIVNIEEKFPIQLGKYKSEEKALEVMELIEDHIRNLYVDQMVVGISSGDINLYSFQNLYDSLIMHKETAIFTMPKE